MKNRNKTRILGFAALIISLFTAACTENGATMVYTVEFSGKDALIKLADFKADEPDFVNVLEKSLAVKEQFPDSLLIDVFYNVWETDLPDKSLASLFMKIDNNIRPDDSNDYVYKVIRMKYFEMQKLAALCIADRLDMYGCRVVQNPDGYFFESDTKRSDVVHYKLKNVRDTAVVRRLITTEGNINLWETYQIDEIGVDFIDSKAASLQFIQEYEQWQSSPILGYVKDEDCETTLSLLNKTKEKAFPENLVFASGKPDPAKNGLIPIYMLKSYRGKNVLDNSVIIDAKTVVRKNSGYKYHVLFLTFDSNGAKRFAEITSRNINHTLPITIDGKVYSAPNVRDRIDGGKMEIVGDFSEEEAKIMAVIVKSGRLSINCNIVNINELH
ncbi:MAG: hypothetical protein LBB85_02755 [Dysgonamonadaceae bacterium]|jgi:SecD/SecF fusion protein|nr:hypothetical protein [Dysgonamonadaceae bacterium]